MNNNTALTDLRDETNASICDLNRRITAHEDALKALAIDTHSQADAVGVADKAIELAGLYSARTQQLNMLASLNSVLPNEQAQRASLNSIMNS